MNDVNGTDAYLDAAAEHRWSISTWIGLFNFGAHAERVRRPIERELTLRVKTGEVVAVRSVGGRVAYVRASDVRPGDRVLHRHRP